MATLCQFFPFLFTATHVTRFYLESLIIPIHCEFFFVVDVVLWGRRSSIVNSLFLKTLQLLDYFFLICALIYKSLYLVTFSIKGTNSCKNDWESFDSRYMGCTTELPSCNQLDVNAWKDMRRSNYTRKHPWELPTLVDQLSLPWLSCIDTAKRWALHPLIHECNCIFFDKDFNRSCPINQIVFIGSFYLRLRLILDTLFETF